MSLTLPANSEEHRLLSLCMLLMSYYPRAGADELAVHLGEVNPFRKGWNYIPGNPRGLVPDRWLLLEDNSGQWTTRAPNVDSKLIYNVQRIPPPLGNTTAWKWATELRSNRTLTFDATSVLSKIERVPQQIGDHQNEREIFVSALRELRNSWQAAKNMEDLQKPVISVVRSYLDFDLPGIVAAQALIAMLANIVIFVSQSGDSTAQLQAQLNMRKDLSDRVFELLDQREGKRAGCFDQMTYVASLYAHSVLLHSDMLRIQFQLSGDQASLLDKSDQNIDELLCYEALPYFVYFSIPSAQRFLMLERASRQDMAQKYGTATGPFIDVATEVGENYAPFSRALLEQAYAKFYS